MLDHVLAQQLLNVRKNGGPSLVAMFRSNIRRYAVLVICLGLPLAVLLLLQIWTAAMLVLGVLIGALLRDTGWMLNIRANWPFTDRVTDWDKVQDMANQTGQAGSRSTGHALKQN